jgi:hypothetical protein
MRKRARTFPPSSARNLAILGGFPLTVGTTLRDAIEANLPGFDTVFVPFSDRRGRAFERGGAIAQLVSAVVGTLTTAQGKARQQGNGPPPPPRRLLLVHPRRQGVEDLLTAFGAAPLAIPIPWPVKWEDRMPGRAEVLNEISPAVMAALEGLNDPAGFARRIWARIEALNPADPLLLPGRNFVLQGGRDLWAALADLRRGGGDPAAFDEAFAGAARYQRPALPDFYARTGGTNKRFATDYRGLVFACPPHGGFHGVVRAVEAGDDRTGLRLLESLFRFGSRLPAGFQHDVQWPSPRRLAQERFACSKRGQILVSGSHANVYPNDVVRETA